MNIGSKIKELRIEKNLTQEELADRAELSIRTRFNLSFYCYFNRYITVSRNHFE